jgi:SAM-dependent methyltransferase
MRTWRDVPGWFDFDDIYDEVIEERKAYTRTVRLVELGVAFGRSAIYLATQIRDRVPPGSQFEFYAIDKWEDVPGAGLAVHPRLLEVARAAGGFRQAFEWYAAECGVRRRVHGVPADQLWAAAQIPDATIDMVFLDTCHTLEGTRAAIRAWLPKVRPGGIFAGHDFTPGWPGVVQAVGELLPGAVRRRSSFFWRVPG